MSNEFPAFIKAEYVEGDAFSRFQQHVTQTIGSTKDQFQRSFAEIGNIISKSITRPANAGKIDLGLPEFRQAAAEAKLYQQSVAATLSTAKTLAQLTGDLTAGTRSYILALDEQNVQATKAALAADKQVATYTRLQTALNATADANSRLSQAQREVYAEQARAAQIEVQQRRRQEGLNEVFAPGLTRRATDNGAGFDALQGLVQQQAAADQAAASLLALKQAEAGAAEGARILAAALQGTALESGRVAKSARDSAAVFSQAFAEQEQAIRQAETAAEQAEQSLLALRQAEAGAAEGARILSAALQGTALEAGRTSKSARESAAAFEAAFAAQERAAREAAAAQQVLAASAAQLRAEIDPMFAAQQRFNTALDRADELFREGAISAREYEQANAQARQQLQAHAASLFQVEAAHGRGTTATRINTESQRANRFAMIQAGQQLQDITISLQSGQRATTVFAQQLPQLAFAFTDVGGKAGQVARFLAGPWGVAVFGAVTALGFLIESLIETSGFLKSTGDEADATATRIASAMQRLNAFGQSASEMTQLFTDTAEVRIDAAGKEARAARLEIDAQRLREQARRPGVGVDKEYTDRRASALKRAQAAEAESKALRAEASAQNAQADATIRASRIRQRNDEALNPPAAIATGGGGGSRGGGGGGGGGIDRSAVQSERSLAMLESRITSLQGRFDPAIAAAREFAEAIASIKEAEGAGIISERQSFDLQIAAMAEQAGRIVQEQNAAVDRFMQVFEPQQMRSAAEEYADVLEDRWASAQNGAANAFVAAVQTGDLLSELSRGRVRPNDLLRLINPGDPRIKTGTTSGDTGINRFLYGKASNEIEIAQGKPAIQGGFVQAYTQALKSFERGIEETFDRVFGEDGAKFGQTIGNALAGAQIGGAIGGKSGKAIGAAIGAVAGSEFMAAVSGPLAIASEANKLIGSVFGFEGGPFGVFTSMLTGTKRGSATIGGSGGTLSVTSTQGNSRSRKAASSESAGEAITTLERIAEALGGSINASRGAVSIGVRDGNIRVDTSGRGVTKTKKGAVDFGEDSAAAIRFATMDLIKDGVIEGIRASTQRLLQSSKDLDTAIQRAVDFEGVFQELKQRKDPIGAAIDTVEKEFTRLRKIFADAGASVEEYASLEELYGVKRTEAVKQATEEAFGSMKALLDDLRFGDNGRSLRDRLAAAQAKFDPLAARVEAGDTTAYDDFADAARALLDIQRQFSGSQTAFFDLQDRITAITARVVEGGNVASILPGGANSAQADAARSFDGSNVVSAIDRQTAELSRILTQIVGGELRAINDNTTGGGSPVSLPGFAQLVQQI